VGAVVRFCDLEEWASKCWPNWRSLF